MSKLLLSGMSASLGKIRGRVRVVDNPNEVNFNRGDILVTEMTNPRFTPLIEKAGAIVTDIGGLLCHAAIMSREFGIPCIVNTKTATTSLKDGQIIEVDADKGKIYEAETNR